MDIMQAIEKDIQPVERTIDFETGDTVRVHYRIVEGTRERIQVYEGVVIAIDNKGISKTFTVRKISFDVGVERVFPVFSPKIAKVEIVRKSKTRRAKLYFLRERRGKSARLKEKRVTSAKKEKKSASASQVKNAEMDVRTDVAETQVASEKTE